MLNSSALVLLLLVVAFVSACQSVPEKAVAPQIEIPADEAEAREDSIEKEENKPDPAAALFELAKWSMQNNQPEDAIDRLNQVLAINPEYPRATTNLALILLSQDKVELAKSNFLTAISQDNQDAIAYNHLAIIQRRAGEFEAALLNYQRALEIDPDYANAHLNMGILQDIYLQRFELALVHYQKYQELDGKQKEKVEKWILDLQRRIGQ